MVKVSPKPQRPMKKKRPFEGIAPTPRDRRKMGLPPLKKRKKKGTGV
jgi:hypothetical protein|tara:strand:+ start:125 stop:265 length:141 start_codon:yes stop_codon:yes gene_type:complete